jgi:hypothetical protein
MKRRYRIGSVTVCPCGFELNQPDTFTFSKQWYRAHRDHHIETFPDVDDVTRSDFEQLIELAKP